MRVDACRKRTHLFRGCNRQPVEAAPVVFYIFATARVWSAASCPASAIVPARGKLMHLLVSVATTGLLI